MSEASDSDKLGASDVFGGPAGSSLPPHDVIIITAARITPTRAMVDRMAILSTGGVDPVFAGFLHAHRILSRRPVRCLGVGICGPPHRPTSHIKCQLRSKTQICGHGGVPLR